MAPEKMNEQEMQKERNEFINIRFKEINKRFDQIDNRFGETHNEMNRRFTEIVEIIKETHKLLVIGNGEPPLMVQVDRLNQESKNLKWYKRIAIISILSLILFCAEENIRHNRILNDTTESIIDQIKSAQVENICTPS